MQFIHSNKQYIERSMYLIGRYQDEATVPVLSMEAFVAPANFDPDAQELNIVKAFAAYPDANKKYIFSVGTSATTVLPSVIGRTYAYAENAGDYTIIASGTVTWNYGSNRRHIIVISSILDNIDAPIPDGAVWVYCDKVHSINSINLYNNSLKYIHFNSLQKITGYTTFNFCSGLIGELVIPSSVRNIEQLSFVGCTGLTKLTLSNGIQVIGNGAFQNCVGLSNELNIPDSVTEMGVNCFASCINITNIVFSSNLTSIPNYCFGMETQANMMTGDVNLPSGITLIDYASFLRNQFSKFDSPSSVTYIGDYAFYDCDKLTTFNSRSINPPIAQGNTFSGINKTTCILHVPSGSLAAYQAAPYWNEFTNIIADL